MRCATAAALALVLLPGALLPAQEDGKDAAWDVQDPPGAWREVAIDTEEGTWMSLDVSPDGREIVFDLLGDIYLVSIEGGEAQPLATGIAWQMQPCFSPDGNSIAFTSDAGGGDNLWVMDRDGGNARAVSSEEFRLLNSPCWTPDGRYVAGRKHFTGKRSLGAGEIWMYHTGGGKGVQLTTHRTWQKDTGEPAFSPDGRWLYFSDDVTPGDSFEYSRDAGKGIYAIRRLDRETGRIDTVAGGPGGAVRPTPSPDGERLAFVRRVREHTVLFVMDLASGEAHPVYDDLERDMQETWAVHGVYPRIAWTPDGRSLVFWARGRIRRVDVETGEARVIPFRVRDTRKVQDPPRFPVQVAPEHFHLRALRQLRIAPDGGRVAYVALGHVWVRDLPDGEPVRLTERDDRFEFFPSFSPDGKEVVFVAWTDAGLASVRVQPLDGSAERILTAEPGHYLEPVFSPDGRYVVYRKATGGGVVSPLWSRDPGLYRVDALSGGEPFRITRQGTHPHFGADPERLYFMTVQGAGQEDKRGLRSIGLDGREERTHLRSKWATEFAISPDGRWASFAEGQHVWVAPFPATGRVQEVGPKMKSLPVARVTRDAGEHVQWLGDSSALAWTLGPELFVRPLRDCFAFLEGAPDPLPEPPVHGQDISFDAEMPRRDQVWALRGGRIVTMRGDEVLENGTVLVRGRRIAAVGPAGEITVPPGAPVVELHGRTVLPGLVDVHAHGGQGRNGILPQANWVNAANLAFGVTTVHDPSHDTGTIFSVAELQRSGGILAPRVFSTGTILYGAAGTYHVEIETLDDARRHLRRMQALGAFSVKSYNQPRRDQRQRILAAAHELGMMVVPEGGSLFMHNLTQVVDGHTGIEHSLPVEHVYDDVLDLWGRGNPGVGYTPTLIVGYGGIWGENYWYQHLQVWRNERLLRFVPRSVVDPRSRRRPMAPEEDYNHLRSAGICKALVDAGGQVQLGAHGQLAGYGAHWELWMLAQGGLTPHEALRAATLDGARYLGLDGDIGSLEPGKLADLVVVDGNPLEDIRQSERVDVVMLDGVPYDAMTLAPLDGSAPPPDFWWRHVEAGWPAAAATAGEACAGCGR